MGHSAEDLLRDYIQAKCGVIFEYSGDFQSSLIELVEEAKKYAEEIGVEWKDEFLDETCWNIINDWK